MEFAREFPLEGYRRLTFMMLDRDVAAASPSSVYRVLKAAGVMRRWNPKPSKKGTGFVQPLAPHEHWHVDVSPRKRPRPARSGTNPSAISRSQAQVSEQQWLLGDEGH